MKYEVKRNLAKRYLLNTLSKHGLTDNHLKGSWQSCSFHLSINENISYSDVDLLVNAIDEPKRNELIEAIQYDLTEYFDNSISVSIHNRRSLYQMSISDAQILGVAEYIAQYRKIRTTLSFPKDYIDTKFTLLLLRNSFDERYQDVSVRIGTTEAKRALDVKMGRKKTFPLEYAKSLIDEYGNPTAVQFLNHCLLNSPNDNITKSTLSQLAQCKTIDRWLYCYLVSKVNQYSVA